MTRKEKIDFIILAVKEIEGVTTLPYQYVAYTDEQLDIDVEWFDYLLDK